MLVIKAGIHKMLVRMANMEDTNTVIRLLLQDLGLHCLSVPFWQATSVQNFGTFTIYILCTISLAIVLYG